MSIKFPFSHKIEEPENGVLYVVGTPIGNLFDISFRAINVLKNVNLIACEDTRHTKKIMNKFEVKNKLLSFNKINSMRKIPILITELQSGKSIALVSDAGMPSICDPGEDLIKDARKKNLKIICIPGACAALTAIVSSGLSCSKFCFEGFLPKKNIERSKIIMEISRNYKTTILYESPHRLKKLLRELKEYCGGDREIHIFRELTKKFEEHIGNNINDVIEYFENKEILGEITLVIKGRNIDKNKKFDELVLKKELHDLVKAGLSLSSASKYLANKENLTKNLIYNLY